MDKNKPSDLGLDDPWQWRRKLVLRPDLCSTVKSSDKYDFSYF